MAIEFGTAVSNFRWTADRLRPFDQNEDGKLEGAELTRAATTLYPEFDLSGAQDPVQASQLAEQCLRAKLDINHIIDRKLENSEIPKNIPLLNISHEDDRRSTGGTPR